MSNSLDEYELAGLSLTYEQKEALHGIGITPQMLNNIKTEIELLDLISQEWKKSIIGMSNTNNKRKSKSWNKKHFWD